MSGQIFPPGSHRSGHVARVTIGILLLSLAPTSAHSRDADARTDTRAALLLFVAYRGNLPVPIHPTDVRVSASRRLAGLFEGDVVTYPEVEPWMRAWRVRSERDLSRDFLRDLSSGLDVDDVMIWKLVAYDDRVVLLGRGVAPREGTLRWAGAEEASFGPDLWEDAASASGRLDDLLTTAGRTLVSAAASPRSTAGRENDALVALPLRPVGLGRGEADLAWQSLLGSLLRAGAWTVPDPALVVDEMQRSGHDPTRLAGAARRHLVETFSARSLLVPRMTAFPRDGVGLATVPSDGEWLESSAQLNRRVPVLLTLTLIDGRSGRVVSGCAEYLPPERSAGLFGRSRSTRITGRYEQGADRLVRALVQDGGAG